MLWWKSLLSWALVAGLALGTVGLIGLAPARVRAAAPPAERHPEMHEALRHLREAKASLEKGAHDFAGHRVAAVTATDNAIKEVEAALESDKDPAK